MQTMSVVLNADVHLHSHTQTNLRRFLALDEEILKLDNHYVDDEYVHTTEPIFKTQLSEQSSDSSSRTKSGTNDVNRQTNMSTGKQKKRTSVASSSHATRDKRKTSEKDFIQRNIELAKEAGGTWALTEQEKQRLNELLDDKTDTVVVPCEQSTDGYVPSMNECQRLKQIDDLLEREYYNPLLNHQLRRNNESDIDYSNQLDITNEENEQLENQLGERVLRETRLQREHMKRLKRIDEKLQYLHRPMIDEKVEAILSDEQLNELLGNTTNGLFVMSNQLTCCARRSI
jgi:hypothetical protein